MHELATPSARTPRRAPEEKTGGHRHPRRSLPGDFLAPSRGNKPRHTRFERFVPWMQLFALCTNGQDLTTDPNGANLRAVWDTAPTGQKRFSLKTQGGAGACPGLWDSAPLGLKLVPFTTDPKFADPKFVWRGEELRKLSALQTDLIENLKFN